MGCFGRVIVNVVVANSRKKSSIRSCLSFYADADYSCRNEMPEFGCIDADDMRSIKKKDHAILEIWGDLGGGRDARTFAHIPPRTH